MERNPFAALAAAELDPEAFVRRALGALETGFRELALLALADWDRAAPPASPRVATAVAAIRRPAWGSWNGLLAALKKARAETLRAADPALRGRLEGATALAAVVSILDERVGRDALEPLAPLAALCKAQTGKMRAAALLAMPIRLRNVIAHDPPEADAWWAETADALRPLVEHHAAADYLGRLGDARPAPWFVEPGGVTHAFNGIAGDGALLFVGPGGGSAAAPEQTRPLLLALRRLLGREDVAERDVDRLLAKLAPDEVRGVVLGDCIVGAPVGEGGFATVHIGRQLSTGRKVAVKILHDGLADEATERFRQEAAWLSRFDQPGIVSVLGYGEEPWSTPGAFADELANEEWFRSFAAGAATRTFIVLEWVEGGSLEDLLRATDAPGDLDERALARLMAEAADALAAVHSNGLLHRDIKPANLMLRRDATGRSSIVVMDFGIARSRDETRTLVTTVGRALGTPAYMSPEQLRAVDADAEVGPATDVYALCATFYELVTRRRVYDHDTTSADLVRTAKLAGRKPAPPRAAVPGLPWELAALIDGGLEPEIGDRPASMADLAADLRRFLEDEPIVYRRPSLARRARLTYRRNRTVANILGAFLVAAVLGAVVYAVSVSIAEGRTEARRLEAVANRTEAKRLEGVANESTVAAQASEAAAIESEADARRRVAVLLTEAGRRELLEGHADRAAVLLAEAWAASDPEVRAAGGPLAHLVRDATERLAPEERFLVQPGDARAAFSPDGATILTAGSDARLWDAATGGLRAVVRGYPLGVEVIAWAPDGRRVATGDADGNVRVIDAASGEVVASMRVSDERSNVWTVAFLGPDGDELLVTSREGRLLVWEPGEAPPRLAVGGEDGARWRQAIAFPDGRRALAFAGDAEEAVVLDLATGERVHAFRQGRGRPGLSRDGARVATVAGKELFLWDAATGEPAATITVADADELTAAAFVSGGARVLVYGPGGAWVVDEAGEADPRRLRPMTGWDAAAVDGGRIVAFAAGFPGRAVLLFDVDDGALTAVLDWRTEEVTALARSPDGGRLLVAGPGGVRVLVPARAARSVIAVNGLAHALDVRWAAQGRRLLVVESATDPRFGGGSGSDDEGLRARVLAVDASGDVGETLASLAVEGASRVAIDPAGRRVAVARHDPSSGEAVEIVDVATGATEASLALGYGSATVLAFTPDGTRLLVGTGADVVLVVAPGSGEIVGRIHASFVHRDLGSVVDVAASDDGRLVATANESRASGGGGAARVWELATARLVATIRDVASGPRRVVFSPDGSRLAVVPERGAASLHDATSGARVRGLGGHAEPVRAIAFDASGSRVATGSADATARVFPVAGDGDAVVLTGHAAPVDAVAFVGEDVVVTASSDGVRLWDAATGAELARIAVDSGSGFDPSRRIALAPQGRLAVADPRGRWPLLLLDLVPESRSPDEVAAIVAPRAPWRLRDGAIVGVAPPDPATALAGALAIDDARLGRADADAFEPNDQLDLAADLPPGAHVDLELGQPREDWYRFVVPARHAWRVEVRSEQPRRLLVEAFGAGAEPLAERGAQTGFPARLGRRTRDEATVLLRVARDFGSDLVDWIGFDGPVPYEIDLVLEPFEPADRFEPNDDPRQAAVLAPGRHDGLVVDGEECYAVEVPPGRRLRVTATVPGAGRVALGALDADHASLARTEAEGEAATLVVAPPRPGRVGVLVGARGAGERAGYVLEVALEPWEPADALEPNDHPDQAVTLANGSYEGLTVQGEDWYMVVVRGGGERLELSVRGAGVAEVRAGESFREPLFAEPVEGEPGLRRFVVDDGDLHILRVRVRGEGRYDLEVRRTVPDRDDDGAGEGGGR